MAGGIFNQMIYLESESATEVFIILLFTILLTEKLIHLAEAWAHETGYKELVEKLFKEMTMMGILSFGTFIASESSKLDGPLYDAFHWSHIFLLFITLNFILQAICLVLLTLKQNKTLNEYAVHTTWDLVEEYEALKTKENSWELWIFQKAPGWIHLRLRDAIESKICEGYFIHVHGLPKEFNYANYMCRSCIRYMLKLIEVAPINWVMLAILVCCNLFRIAVIDPVVKDNGGMHGCIEIEQHRRLAGTDDDDHSYKTVCVQYLVETYVVGGFILVILNCILLYFCDVLKHRLMWRIYCHFNEVASLVDGGAATSLRCEYTDSELLASRDFYENCLELIAEDELIHPPNVPDLKMRSRSNSIQSSRMSTPSRSRQGSIYSESGEREPKSPSAAALRRKYSISTAAKLEAVEKRLATHAEPVQLSELEEGQAGGDRPLSVGVSSASEGVGASNHASSMAMAKSSIKEQKLAHMQLARSASAMSRPASMRNRTSSLSASGDDAPGGEIRKSPSAAFAFFGETSYHRAESMERFQATETRHALANKSLWEKIVHYFGVFSHQFVACCMGEHAGGDHKNGHSPPSRQGSQEHGIGMTSMPSVSGGAPKLSASEEAHLAHKESIKRKEEYKKNNSFLHRTYDAMSSSAANTFGFSASASALSSSAEEAHDQVVDWNLRIIFPPNMSTKFYRSIQIMALLQSVYVALWATDFSELAALIPEKSVEYSFALVIPIILNFYLLYQVIFTSGVVRSMTHRNMEVQDEICEEAREQRNVCQNLRDAIIETIQLSGVERCKWRDHVFDAFEIADEDKSLEIDSEEFIVWLRILGCHFSRRSSNRIFSALDRDQSNAISWKEISFILFPEFHIEELVKEDESLTETEILRAVSSGTASTIETEEERNSTEGELSLGQGRQGSKQKKAKLMRRSMIMLTTSDIGVSLTQDKEKEKNKDKEKDKDKEAGTSVQKPMDANVTETPVRPRPSDEEVSVESSNKGDVN